ncbi:hypothetical protein LPJ61_004082 [Coemansia biformis]|uniref:Uncharacterized protein n=1 Tax=Coemansia biformis TaxID=1286918 RepID=A0A9W7YA11_9FUNG|nr:hypothetical protein LPJ61_004082 [Coemansia biformis]
MSVNNLERADVQRTEIDDMESVLYILLWHGVRGVTAGDRGMTADKESIIDVWNADRSDAAMSKRNLLRDFGAMVAILRDFHEPTANLTDNDAADEHRKVEIARMWYDKLTRITIGLHASLFRNPDAPPDARGTNPSPIASDWDDSEPATGAKPTTAAVSCKERFKSLTDPFKVRADPDIANKLYNAFVDKFNEYIRSIRQIVAVARSSDKDKELAIS